MPPIEASAPGSMGKNRPSLFTALFTPMRVKACDDDLVDGAVIGRFARRSRKQPALLDDHGGKCSRCRKLRLYPMADEIADGPHRRMWSERGQCIPLFGRNVACAGRAGKNGMAALGQVRADRVPELAQGRVCIAGAAAGAV